MLKSCFLQIHVALKRTASYTERMSYVLTRNLYCRGVKPKHGRTVLLGCVHNATFSVTVRKMAIGITPDMEAFERRQGSHLTRLSSLCDGPPCPTSNCTIGCRVRFTAEQHQGDGKFLAELARARCAAQLSYIVSMALKRTVELFSKGSASGPCLRAALFFALNFAGLPSLNAQSARGELGLYVASASGRPLAAIVTLVSQSRQYDRTFATDERGRATANALLLSDYVLRIVAPGFQPVSRRIAVTSEVPHEIHVTLSLAPVQQSVLVTADSELVDPSAPSPNVAVGLSQVQQKLSAQPGREFLEVVQDQPGWLFEANGVLHPRGSEYDTQFVIDGVPRTENLSPPFAAPPSAGAVESAEVYTAGFPAEYGRSLGGVIDVTTGAALSSGWHGQLESSGGAFSTTNGAARLSFGTNYQNFSVESSAFHTSRFLDPPVLDNFDNHGTGVTGELNEQFNLTQADRFKLAYSYASLQNMVPNDLQQETSGQRQDRSSRQDSGSLSWQHIFSADKLFTTAGSFLSSHADLTSNADATPINVSQSRGFNQGWLRIDLAGENHRHEWKVGADTILRHVHEQLSYNITDPDAFDPGTLAALQFNQRHWDSEPSAFVQDTFHAGSWNFAAGLRYDDYSFLVHREAWSPRVAISRFFPSAHLSLHASYDRIFQVPAIENLLLASSPAFDSVSTFVQRLPVQPAYAHYFEFGGSEQFANRVRVAVNLFLRSFRNYGDDDTLLNTGVSFPIADSSAQIRGEECSLYLPEWHGLLLDANYSNQIGIASGPVTGGLLIGAEGADDLSTTDKFPISQDQRNTVRARARWTPLPLLWFGLHLAYNSGLPVELDDEADMGQLRSAYGDRVLSKIDFDRGRVRPWSSTDLSVGTHLLRRGDRDLSLEVQVTNISNGLHVVNFASLFSGTALASPRASTVRLRYAF